MAFPEGWSTDPNVYLGPYPPKEGRRPKLASSRGGFFLSPIAVTSLLFSEGVVDYRAVDGVDPQYRSDPDALLWLSYLYIFNTGLNPIEITFDGVNVHCTLDVSAGWQFVKVPHAGFAVRRTLAGVSSYTYVAS